MGDVPEYGHIVVGVDGSPLSRVALLWAARRDYLSDSLRSSATRSRESKS